MKAIIKNIGILAILPAMVIGSCTREVESNSLSTGDFPETSMALKDATDIIIGAAIDYTPMINDPKYAEIVKRDNDAVTFGYQMKHAAIVQDNGTMNFTNTDALVAAVGTLGIFGHTLGWHDNVNSNYLKTFAGITIPASAELLLNEGFEQGTATTFNNWSTFNAQSGSTVAPTTITGEMRTGTRAMKVVANVGEPANQWKVQVASDFINTVSGTQYRATYYVRTNSGAGSIRLSTATSGGGSAQYQGDQPITSTYSQISWTFTANSPQTRLVIDMGAAITTYFIDDASVKEVIPAPSGAQIATKLDLALGNFITATVNRYKGKVRAWDVVNEPMSPSGAYRVTTNSSDITNIATRPGFLMWSDYMGRDYPVRAFLHAKNADPTADLYINDFGLESSAAKTDSLINFVTELKAKGAKIDGIGTQMHVTRNTSYAGIDAMMQKLGATGLKIRISELDVRTVLSSSAGTATPQFLAYQAVMYKYIVQSYLKYIPKPQQAGITVWGVNDKTSWLYNNGAELPLLYDINYNKKPAYSGFVQGLQGK